MPTRSKKSRARTSPTVLLRTASLELAIEWPKGTDLPQLQRAVMEWSHVVRNRRRWAPNADTVDQQARRARTFLTKTLSVSEADRAIIAASEWVEVVIPFGRESEAWEARILPWEYILTAGTRDIRKAPLVVLRRLQRAGAARTPPRDPAVLFVESAPGRIANCFDFKDEKRLVQANTNRKKFTTLESPTRGELSAALKKYKPDIVHLAGADNHQGLALVDDPRAASALDGYLMAGSGSKLDPVEAKDLAVLFKDHPPALVVCNFWNSAARIAALLVGEGRAGAALGFQDSFVDSLAELFIASFYKAIGAGWPLDEAFELAWDPLRDKPKLTGTGISLWRGGGTRAAVSRRQKVEVSEPKVLPSEGIAAEELQEIFGVTIKPLSEISYALLHNERDLFTDFYVRKFRPEQIHGVSVRVELHVGDTPYPYRETLSLVDEVTPLASKVRIPLTSGAHRSVDEIMRTTLFVEIRWGKHEICSRTFSTTLTPIDQWSDSDRDRRFLPSFVFPRDEAVLRILDAAQQYVTALRDDPDAGFDGYQPLMDPEIDEPELEIDNQVQAIWYAITYKVPVTYIDPPATYPPSSDWQRVRSPTEVVATGRGTCIDLALLMASSLEAIGLYPVIFLLAGHAFPGYWRSDEAQQAFSDRISRLPEDPRSESAESSGSDESSAAASREEPGGWYLPKKYYREIQKEVQANRLVPLETVGLTNRSSFGIAMAEATRKLADAAEFDSMIDIHAARDAKITPLPLSTRVQLSDAPRLTVKPSMRT